MWPRFKDEIGRTTCLDGHRLDSGSVHLRYTDVNVQGQMSLTDHGKEWLLEASRPAPDWQTRRPLNTPPLRAWQVEALDAWCNHARHGVVEAVTGTGKSRVGIEATREALADDYSVVIAVPTIDLVDQWVKSLRELGIRAVGALGDGRQADFHSHDVVVGTIQSLYLAPPTRADGKVLLIADECHRYGAEQWGKALHPSYRRRLGLTATFERNDDGLETLLNYFGGPPVYKIGFGRAIEDGIVARYDVKLLGVPLTPAERHAYERADETAKDTRSQLLAAGFRADPFGVFLHEVQQAADGDSDPTICDVARRYLKAFSQRIDVMTNAWNKLNAMEVLTPTVRDSKGAIVFTRRVETAEALASVLAEQNVRAAPVHSDLSRAERKERLLGLKVGRLKALVAPTVLDEGIDVPDIDLAIVMGGSKSRRQMIQRMGRVLRLKRDGRKATFIVVYAMNTAEDLTETDGAEGCLDLIVESADHVEALTFRNDEIAPSTIVYRRQTKASPTAPAVAQAVPPKVPARLEIEPDDVAVTQPVIDQYKRAHPFVDDSTAQRELRILLRELLKRGKYAKSAKTPGAHVLRARGFVLVIKRDRFVQYDCTRGDRARWTDLTHTEGPSKRAEAPSVEKQPATKKSVNPNVTLSPFSAKPIMESGLGSRSSRAIVGSPFESANLPAASKDRESPAAADLGMPAAATRAPQAAPPTVDTPSTGATLVDQLERLAQLKTRGLLTDDEFQRAKRLLLE